MIEHREIDDQLWRHYNTDKMLKLNIWFATMSARLEGIIFEMELRESVFERGAIDHSLVAD